MDTGGIHSQLDVVISLDLDTRIDLGDHVKILDAQIQMHLSAKKLGDVDLGNEGVVFEFLKNVLSLMDVFRTDAEDDFLADESGFLNLLALLFRKLNGLALELQPYIVADLLRSSRLLMSPLPMMGM